MTIKGLSAILISLIFSLSSCESSVDQDAVHAAEKIVADKNPISVYIHQNKFNAEEFDSEKILERDHGLFLVELRLHSEDVDAPRGEQTENRYFLVVLQMRHDGRCYYNKDFAAREFYHEPSQVEISAIKFANGWDSR